MTSRMIFFICLVAVSALSVESVLGPGVEVSFEEMFYSTRKTINNSKDLENVLGKTCRIMAFQSPIVDLYGVRAYFPNEDLSEVKKLLLGFEKNKWRKTGVASGRRTFVQWMICRLHNTLWRVWSFSCGIEILSSQSAGDGGWRDLDFAKIQ